jgi:geranylgeranyl pyrophosphate synthase
MTAETITSIQQVIVDTGGLAELEQHISNLTESAVTSLNAAPITAVAKTELIELAEFVAKRTV